MKPEISVIVPVYNVETWLEECLNSIAAQTLSGFEVLLINDGSTDDSLEILKQWETGDSRFKVITRDNGGLSAARNTGLEHAEGKYVVFVDSDDVIAPDYLKHLYDAAVNNQADISVCDMEYFDETGRRTFSSGGNFTVGSVTEQPELIAINNSACNKLFKKELLNDLQFPEGKYYEDLATVPILLYKANRIAKVDEPLYFYRQRSGSIAHKASPKIFDIYDAIDGLVDYLKENDVKNDSTLMKEVMHLYIIHGLDLTTLRIKDFDDKDIRTDYLKENMLRLQQSYPNYQADENYTSAGMKKKMIWNLLKQKQWKLVLKLYG